MHCAASIPVLLCCQIAKERADEAAPYYAVAAGSQAAQNCFVVDLLMKDQNAK